MAGNPDLVFATPPITTGVPTSGSSTCTFGQPTQAGNLLVVHVVMAPLSNNVFPTFPVGWTKAASDVGLFNSSHSSETWYKWNCAANEPAFPITFSQACQNTIFPLEFKNVKNGSDPFISAGVTVAPAAGFFMNGTSNGVVNAGDLLMYICSNFIQSFIHYTVAAGYSFAVQQVTSTTAQALIQYQPGTQTTGVQTPSNSVDNSDFWSTFVIAFQQQPSLIVPGTGSLSLTPTQPTVRFTASRQPNAGAMAITGNAPTVRRSVQPSQAVLALVGQLAVVSRSTVITPGTGSLTMTGVAPTTTIIVPVALQPQTGSMSILGTSSNLFTTITPVTGGMTAIGQSPPLGLKTTPATGSLTLTGAPAVFDRTITPNTGAFSFTGIAPTLIQGVVEVPGTGSLVLTGQNSTNQIVITPVAIALTLTGQLVLAVQNSRRNPLVRNIFFTGNAPLVINGVRPVPFVGALAFTGTQAQVIRGNVITPNTGVLGVAGQNVAVTKQFTVKPSTGVLNLAGSPQFVGVGIVPNSGALILVSEAPNAPQGNLITPDTGTLDFASDPPVFVFDSGFVPGTADMAVDGQLPQLSYSIIPGTGELVFTEGTKDIPTRITPKTGKLTLEPIPPLLGRDIQLFGLRLEDR